MGFTNVAWESRSTEQLARDLTEGPGPRSVGQAGAAWVRVADEIVSVAEDYGNLLEQLRASFASRGADVVANKLEQFGGWLQAISLSAAANGERAEEAATANGVAVLAMPSLPEAVQERVARDVMDSLAAYNGAILNGRFAELDDAASVKQADAASVMYQYEESCSAFATPWDQPTPPDVCRGDSLQAERRAKAADDDADGAGTAGGAVSAAAAPTPLTPFTANQAKSSADRKALRQVTSGGAGGSSSGGMDGYGPMGAGAMARAAGGQREHESILPAATLDGSGEPGAGLSDASASWLPAAQQSDAAFTVSSVSWGPSTSIFDELGQPDHSDVPAYAEEPEATLEQVSSQWAAPAVIGIDKGLTL
ncbi:PPE domain-containing protein [Mycobacterium sp. URHB0021]